MLRFKSPALVGVGAILAIGTLLATPAAAAPSTDRGSLGAAKEAAGTASLPPNVTVKIIGTVPKVDGPTDVYREGDTSTEVRVAILAPSTLPFNFVLDDVSFGIESRRFTTTRTSVCMDIAIHAVKNPGAAFGSFQVTLYQDVTGTDPSKGSVPVPRDGVARSFCWTGTSSGKTYYFTYGFGTAGGSGNVFEYVDGTGTVRNP